jgi:hypothetical protein
MVAHPTPVDQRIASMIATLNRRLSTVEAIIADPVAVGSTLSRTSLSSSNYVPGSTGWAINSDGTGEITADVTVVGADGTKVTIGPTPPVDPNGGDFWFDSSSGAPIMKVYNAGTAQWTIYQWGTDSIEDNAITQALMSNNAVGTAQLIDGSIGQPQLADGAVGAAQLLTGSVGLSQLASGVTAQALGGITTTVSPNAPANPNVGDIWIKASS